MQPWASIAEFLVVLEIGNLAYFAAFVVGPHLVCLSVVWSGVECLVDSFVVMSDVVVLVDSFVVGQVPFLSWLILDILFSYGLFLHTHSIHY